MKMWFCWNTAFCMLYILFCTCPVSYSCHNNQSILMSKYGSDFFLRNIALKIKSLRVFVFPHASVTGRCDWCLGGACCCIVRPHAPVTLHGPRGHLLTHPPHSNLTISQ